jgi:hypothetical protein
MFKFRRQNAGQNRDRNVDLSKTCKVKHLGSTVYQNFKTVFLKILKRNSGKDCYRSVRNIFSPLLSQNKNVFNEKTVNFICCFV